MNAVELVEQVTTAGGCLSLTDDGKHIRAALPEDALGLVDILRQHKAELIGILRARGGRVATFPHCPKCASYALYRQDNIGDYECTTCALQGIPEETARRVQ